MNQASAPGAVYKPVPELVWCIHHVSPSQRNVARICFSPRSWENNMFVSPSPGRSLAIGAAGREALHGTENTTSTAGAAGGSRSVRSAAGQSGEGRQGRTGR